MKNNYPSGWLAYEMQRDLDGFLGSLDIAVPDILTKDDIYGKDRLTKKIKAKDVGAIGQDADWEVQYLWWNSESFSNWLDGLIRTAYALNDKEKIEKAQKYIFHVLNTQDEDGYLGIYDDDLRYNFSSENGELWAQATFLRAALSYYQCTNDSIVLQKVIKAVAVTMNTYVQNESHPFALKSDYAGACHGLMYVDVCYTLYKYTSDIKYLNYAGWLYDEYSQQNLSEKDIQKNQLQDFDLLFEGHGPHTYEHFRALLIHNLTNDGGSQALVQSYLQKLSTSLTPSGGPIGDEWILGRTANATETGYEYCSIQELLHSYHMYYEMNQDEKYIDKLEWLFYNAGFGARHPSRSQIAYCQRDNAYLSSGSSLEGNAGENIRYKYSVAHQDVAVCCVPNAGRIHSYFLDAVYQSSDDQIDINIYVPSSTKRVINGNLITIEQITNYPFELSSKIIVSGKAKCKIKLRKPGWAKTMKVKIDGKAIEYHGFVEQYYDNTEIEVQFETAVIEHSDFVGDKYYSYGPLVYCLEIPSCLEEKRQYLYGQRDALYTPNTKEYQDWNIGEIDMKVKKIGNSFQNPTRIQGSIVVNNLQREVEFTPMGSAILRKITFKR